MADLGNLAQALRFQCKRCGWRPPEDMEMQHAQLHFQVEHDTDQVTFDLVPVCSCGAAMTFARTAPTGGGVKDHFTCPGCASTGFVKRDGNG